MKNKTFLIGVLILVGLVLLPSLEGFAQCAMCKAAQNSSGFSSRGLNTGILYLMTIPYVAFACLAFFWYKASKNQKEQQRKIAEVLKGKI